jgi:hypothetical protein
MDLREILAGHEPQALLFENGDAHRVSRAKMEVTKDFAFFDSPIAGHANRFEPERPR